MSKIEDAFSYNVRKTINTWGKDITIYTNSTANCSSCAYNPITKDATNPSCSTCNGSFFFNISTSQSVKGIVRNFLGNLGYYDYVTRKVNFYPDADIRLTCWFDDVLFETSDTVTFFHKTNDILIEDKHYSIKKLYIDGIGESKVCIVTLEEIKK